MVNNPHSFPVKNSYVILLALGIFFIGAAVSCQAMEQKAADVPETASPDRSLQLNYNPEPAPLEIDTASAAGAIEQVNHCLACHVDQQALKDSADPEVVLESESSGEG